MSGLAEQVVILILMMAVGFLCTKINMISNEGRGLLTKIVINITSPLLVIKSFQMQFENQLLINMGIMAVFAALSMLLFYFLGARMWRVGDDGKRRVLWQAMIFSNCGFMGYPVLYSLFGDTGVAYGSVYVMLFTIYQWTLGVSIYAGKSGSWKDIVLQPGLIAVVVGLLFFLFGVKLPGYISGAVADLGNMNTPLAMMIVGALVAEGDFHKVFKEWAVFAGAAMRLIALPALSLFAFWALWRAGLPGAPGLGSDIVAACILITAMPVAANVAIFASMYEIQPQFAAQTVLVSTLFSVATVPLWMMALQFVIKAVTPG
jgi:malate permease and related proteins